MISRVYGCDFLAHVTLTQMLQLQQTLTYPATDTHFLHLPDESLVVGSYIESSIVSYSSVSYTRLPMLS